MEKQYKFENYLNIIHNNTLRRNITSIRISTHNLPIESLRKNGITRENRTCHLCGNLEIGSEIHAIMYCQNQIIKKHRDHLNLTLSKIYQDWNKLTPPTKFVYLINASDENCLLPFAIFLGKIYQQFKK